jgi:hypothetical protein
MNAVLAPWARPWRDASVLFVLLFGGTLAALALDHRLLGGISVWIKPLKFQVAVVMHFGTLILLARLLPAARRASQGLRWLVASSTGAALFEIGYIMLQAGRGRASHFNHETVAEYVLYIAMGVGAVVLVLAPFVMGLWLWRDHGKWLRSDPLRLAAALGMVLSALTTLVVAGFLSAHGSHWVGHAAGDAGGLPLFGWSQQVGDLRVPHFFATHGLQLVPLLGYALRRRGARGALYVAVGAAAWLALTAMVFVQALQGRPFLVLG